MQSPSPAKNLEEEEEKKEILRGNNAREEDFDEIQCIICREKVVKYFIKDH